jgi:hypothetical protein
VGGENIRGVTTEHYRVNLSQTALQALDEAAEEGSLLEWFGLGDDASAIRSIDVWIGRDNLIRRIQYKGDNTSGITEFYDFGTDISIEAPAVTPGK